MTGPMRPVTRRSFVSTLLITTMTCIDLGCGSGADVTVNPKGGGKRRQLIEDLQKRADINHNSKKKKAPSR
jgi:hypothetical protein